MGKVDTVHIATKCIVDAKTAMAVAAALKTDDIILTNADYFKFLNAIHPNAPWEWKNVGAWCGFFLNKTSYEWVPMQQARMGEVVHFRPQWWSRENRSRYNGWRKDCTDAHR